MQPNNLKIKIQGQTLLEKKESHASEYAKSCEFTVLLTMSIRQSEIAFTRMSLYG